MIRVGIIGCVGIAKGNICRLSKKIDTARMVAFCDANEEKAQYAAKTHSAEGDISIEREDGLMSSTEGLEKAIHFLKDVLIYDQSGPMWWA